MILTIPLVLSTLFVGASPAPTAKRGYDPGEPKWRNWQTRRTQNPVPERACGFDSHLRHGRCVRRGGGTGARAIHS